MCVCIWTTLTCTLFPLAWNALFSPSHLCNLHILHIPSSGKSALSPPVTLGLSNLFHPGVLITLSHSTTKILLSMLLCSNLCVLSTVTRWINRWLPTAIGTLEVSWIYSMWKLEKVHETQGIKEILKSMYFHSIYFHELSEDNWICRHTCNWAKQQAAISTSCGAVEFQVEVPVRLERAPAPGMVRLTKAPCPSKWHLALFSPGKAPSALDGDRVSEL